ncbi:hypothetical protein QBC37DRAFT_449462 [Rhypophila decipiens]|uniref:Uncharacterized protein n=1 Tax=Rhypophila decipiens TaxID=261697 RepID=A0AAN7B4D1_9PEZI|nr:hypothetical protein QBC37DRAFT_449462 [Rhypophila decipiens]
MKPNAILTILTLSLSPTGTLAACGKVTNNSGREMRYTTNPNANLSARPGRCRFWNWYDGDGPLSLIPRDKTVSCDQVRLASGSSAGNCPVDVDGFTFANDAYWIGARRVGAGVWTKFPDIVDVTCRRVPVTGSILCTLI